MSFDSDMCETVVGITVFFLLSKPRLLLGRSSGRQSSDQILSVVATLLRLLGVNLSLRIEINAISTATNHPGQHCFSRG